MYGIDGPSKGEKRRRNNPLTPAARDQSERLAGDRRPHGLSSRAALMKK